MTQEHTPALNACPFCRAQLTELTAVQYPKMGLARLHPGDLSDGTCPIAGWGFYAEQLEAWQARTPDPAVAGLVEAAVNLRKGIREAGVKRDPHIYERVMAFDAALATWSAQ